MGHWWSRAPWDLGIFNLGHGWPRVLGCFGLGRFGLGRFGLGRFGLGRFGLGHW